MKALILLLLTIILAACEPEATPIPAFIAPTATLPIEPTAPPPLRYAFGANTAGKIADLDLIESSGLMIQLETDGDGSGLGIEYDLVAAYGLWPGWVPSPVMPHVSLIVNTKLAPLDDPLLANLARLAVNPVTILAAQSLPGAAADPVEAAPQEKLRAELANLGFPDGFALNIAAMPIPGAEAVIDQLAAANFEGKTAFLEADTLQTVVEANQVHLAVIHWTTQEDRAGWVEQMGGENVIDLYTTPISYLALPELTVNITRGGWPLASR